MTGSSTPGSTSHFPNDQFSVDVTVTVPQNAEDNGLTVSFSPDQGLGFNLRLCRVEIVNIGDHLYCLKGQQSMVDTSYAKSNQNHLHPDSGKWAS